MSSPVTRRLLAQAVQDLVKTNTPTAEHYAAVTEALAACATEDIGHPVRCAFIGSAKKPASQPA